MMKKYFFKNLTSNSAEIIPVNDSTNGTIASFSLSQNDLDSLSNYTKPNPYEFGLVVSGDIQNSTVLLELFDGNNWIIIQEYEKVDLLKTIGTDLVPIINILSGGIMFDTKHRLRIINTETQSLTGISAYFLLY